MTAAAFRPSRFTYRQAGWQAQTIAPFSLCLRGRSMLNIGRGRRQTDRGFGRVRIRSHEMPSASHSVRRDTIMEPASKVFAALVFLDLAASNDADQAASW